MKMSQNQWIYQHTSETSTKEEVTWKQAKENTMKKKKNSFFFVCLFVFGSKKGGKEKVRERRTIEQMGKVDRKA
jgi:hypothetical protein